MRAFFKTNYELLLSLIFGSLVGTIFVLALGLFSEKWGLFLLVASIVVSTLLFIKFFMKKLGITLLLASLFVLPFPFDINFLYRDHQLFFFSANGFSVTIFDLFFLPLLFTWLYQGKHNTEASFIFEKHWVILFSLLFIIYVVSCFNSAYPFYSFSALIEFLKAIFIFFFFANNLKKEQTFLYIGRIFALILLVQGLIVIEQKFIGVIFTQEFMGKSVSIVSLIGTERVTRIAGTLSHPNDLAMFLNLFIPVVILLAFQEKKWFWRVFFFSSILLAVITEIWTSSRGGWVGLSAALMFSIPLVLHKKGLSYIKIFLVSVILIITTVSSLLASSSTFRNRIFGEDYGTADLRIPLMQVAENIIKTKPLMGVGFNTYGAEMEKYDNTPEYITRYYKYPVHNTFLLMAAETGLPSMLLFFSFITLLLFKGWQAFHHYCGVKEAMAIGLVAGVISWLIHNTVNLDAVYMNRGVWILLGMIAALVSTAKHDQGSTLK